MTITADAARIFEDARNVHSEALGRLDEGDVRDAAEKAWCATKRATDALILARTGVEPERSTDTRIGLERLANADQGARSLVGRYYSRQSLLHGDCFYLGICEPMETIERRIREADRYIQDAQSLAET